MPRFTQQMLSGFRHRLERRRVDLMGLEDRLEKEGLSGWSEEETGELSRSRLHPADLGTNEFERDLSLMLAEDEVREVQDIDEALIKIQNETYGICSNCANEIPIGRLEALPFARYCGACEHEIEKRQREIAKKRGG